MNYRIQEIEGIGPSYGDKLAGAGIGDTDTLLKVCGAAKGRKETAATTGISEALLLKWANLADLMRVSGIGKQFAELLEAAGVDTVKELKNRRADNLSSKMKEVNDAKKLSRSCPSESQVGGWIDQAKKLDPAISH